MPRDLHVDLGDYTSAALRARFAFIEESLDRAWDLTAPERRHHIVVIQRQPRLVESPDDPDTLVMRAPAPPAVACSWPHPPPHARPVETVRSGRLL